MNKYTVLPLLAFVIFLSQYLGNFRIIDLGYLIVGAFALVVNRHHINIVGLINIVLIVRTIEYVTWLIWDTYNAYHVYPVQITLDILTIYLIGKRWEIFLRLHPATKPSEIVFTHADYFLKRLYQVHIAVTLSALLEHLLRHPYDLGLPESWAMPDADFIYNHIIKAKFILNILEFVLILSMAHAAMRKSKV